MKNKRMEKTWKYGDRREDGFIYHGTKRNGKLKFLSPEADARKKEGAKLRESLKPKKGRAPAKGRKKKKYDPIKAKAYRDANPNKFQYDPVKSKKYRIKNGKSPDAKKGRPPIDPKLRRKRINYSVKSRLANDPLFKLQFTARTRLGHMIRKIKAEKPAKTIELIGCSWQKLKKHIESQFTDGMTWENHGLHGWHIDHIVPLSCATEIKGLTKLCHYSNLRPLWAKENRKKKDNLVLI
jgi:hypothetical protein